MQFIVSGNTFSSHSSATHSYTATIILLASIMYKVM